MSMWLTKSCSPIELAAAMTQMEIPFQPDPHITSKANGRNQFISAFPATEELCQDVDSYDAEAVLVELRGGIAAAGGQIDDVELERITSQLETQFDLSSRDRVRLERSSHYDRILAVRGRDVGLLRMRPGQFTAAYLSADFRQVSEQRNRHDFHTVKASSNL